MNKLSPNMTLFGLFLLVSFIVLFRTLFIFVVWNYLFVGGWIPEITLLQSFAFALLFPVPISAN